MTGTWWRVKTAYGDSEFLVLIVNERIAASTFAHLAGVGTRWADARKSLEAALCVCTMEGT